MRWSYKFESYGGYDCMSGAYHVYRGGEYVLKIDVADVLSDDDDVDDDLVHSPHPVAEALARAICQRMDGL